MGKVAEIGTFAELEVDKRAYDAWAETISMHYYQVLLHTISFSRCDMLTASISSGIPVDALRVLQAYSTEDLMAVARAKMEQLSIKIEPVELETISENSGSEIGGRLKGLVDERG